MLSHPLSDEAWHSFSSSAFFPCRASEQANHCNRLQSKFLAPLPLNLEADIGKAESTGGRNEKDLFDRSNPVAVGGVGCGPDITANNQSGRKLCPANISIVTPAAGFTQPAAGHT